MLRTGDRDGRMGTNFRSTSHAREIAAFGIDKIDASFTTKSTSVSANDFAAEIGPAIEPFSSEKY